MSLLARTSHYSRWLVHHLASPHVAVIGEYHGANLGDHLLGTSVTGYFQQRHMKSVRLTLHSLARWRRFPDADVIVGGGNILNDHSLGLLRTYLQGHRKSARCLGVDFCDSTVLDRNRDVLDQFAQITFRSADQRAIAVQVLGESWNDRLGCHPDLAWLHHARVQQAVAGSAPQRRIALNILPLYLKHHENTFSCAYAADHEFHDQAQKETAAYLRIVEKTVRHFQSLGYEVIHLPFAVEDATFAQQWLLPLGVKCVDYTLSLEKMAKTLASCEAFIPTRFHALVIGLMTGMPIRPIPYAKKNSDLVAQLGHQDWAAQTPRVFCEDESHLTSLLCDGNAIRMQTATCQNYGRDIRQWLDRIAQ